MPIRPALARDTDFLWRVLLEAYNWNGEQRFTVEQLVVDPYAARYLAGWPRKGDFGVVDETDAGEPVGAAWARCLPEDEPGYGFVAPDVPELTLGVLPGQRGHGHGRALMEALIRAAGERPASVDRLSLSVEDGNPAVRLYTSLGFTRVGRNGGSDKMLLDLRARKPRTSQADKWALHLTAARQFYEREGHLQVPRKHVERIVGEDQEEQELRLGAWVGNQRSRAATLTPERVEQLSQIGMRWT